MAGKRKLEKFAMVSTFPNTFQNFRWENPVLINHEEKEVVLSGKWRSEFFQNENPIVIELACGYGEYTIGLAERYPEKNFIGVDIKGNRVYQGAKYALENEMSNVAFVRTDIRQIEYFFAAGEIDEIWITFPDPFRKKRQAKNRLTDSQFLDRYRKILRQDGVIHLKSDSDIIYEYTKEVLEELKLPVYVDCDNIDEAEGLDPVLKEIQTRYEKIHRQLRQTIKYIQFGLN